LPPPVSGFLTKAWRDRLVFILLRDKEEDRGEAWQQAVNTAEELINSFDQRIGPLERHASLGTIDQLRERITEGVEQMGSYTHSTLDALFSLLDAPERGDGKHPAGIVQEPMEIDVEIEAAQPRSPTPFSQVVPAAEIQQVSQEEQDLIKRLRKLKQGTWFEIKSDTGVSPRRIKLSWLSPLTATCMFVDRSGIQAEIKTLHELAREILSGRASIISRPKHPFIERALVAIRTMLQVERNQPSSTAQTE
jgi:hypothetical protein